VATNRLLEDLVECRRFRADLFYRLTGIDIWLPSLRERPADIPALVAHFLQLHSDQERTFLPAVIDALCRYPWPGNVRELERVVQRCLAASSNADIGLDALPQRLSSRQHRAHVTPLVDISLRACAVRHVQTVLEECRGDKGLACRRLGITYRTLRSYLGIVATRARLA
jgi:transcriptional regulator with PAS, ATPase and Fis domain